MSLPLVSMAGNTGVLQQTGNSQSTSSTTLSQTNITSSHLGTLLTGTCSSQSTLTPTRVSTPYTSDTQASAPRISTAQTDTAQTTASFNRIDTFVKHNNGKRSKTTTVTVSAVGSDQFRTRPSFWQRLFHLGWWWEIGGILVGVACTCLTIAILFSMNGRPLHTWNLPIQPNSLIAVFSTVGKSAILIPIAECISQLKWIHFEAPHPRPLSQMQVFDDASRGPWGAFVFLWKSRIRSPPLLASLGAVVTLLLLAFEPFAQQVMEFPSRLAPASNLSGSVSYTNDLLNSAVDATLDARKSRALYSLGIRGTLFDMASAVPTNAYCDTQDCRLPDFTSLGSCATCETEPFNLETATNCTFVIQRMSTNQTEYQYPGTVEELLTLLRGAAESNMFYWGASCSRFRPGYPEFGVTVSWNSVGGPQAYAPLSYRMNNTHSYYIGKSTAYDTTEYEVYGEDYNATNLFSYCFIEHPDFHSRGVETIFPYTCFTMPNNVTEFLPASVNQGKFQKPITGTIKWCTFQFCAQRYEKPAISNGILKPKNVQSLPLRPVSKTKDDYHLQTNSIPETTFTVGRAARDQLFRLVYLKDFMDLYNAADAWGDGNWNQLFKATQDVVSTLIQSTMNPQHQNVSGPAYAQETYVRVRWAWYMLPLSGVLLATLLLLCTALRSARKPYLYKTSFLAGLFRGLEGWQEEELRPKAEWRTQETGWDLLQIAEKEKARFVRNGEGDLKIMKAS